MLSPIDIKNVIQRNMQCEVVEVKGDDGAHFEAIIVSNIFDNMSSVKHIN